MARPKSLQHDLRRDEILDIAAQCFAERSYAAASMNDIAAAGGTSKARLYHYYESKEAILFDLLDRYTQRLLALIGQTEATAQRRNLDDRAALHELIRAFLEEYGDIFLSLAYFKQCLDEIVPDVQAFLAWMDAVRGFSEVRRDARHARMLDEVGRDLTEIAASITGSATIAPCSKRPSGRRWYVPLRRKRSQATTTHTACTERRKRACRNSRWRRRKCNVSLRCSVSAPRSPRVTSNTCHRHRR